MVYTEIDITKLNHFASSISSDKKELMKLFKFTLLQGIASMAMTHLSNLLVKSSHVHSTKE